MKELLQSKNNLQFYLAVVLLFMLLAIGYWTPPFLDDFYRLTEIRASDPISHAVKRYRTWDGRELNLFSLIRNSAYYVFYSWPQIINFLWGLIFVAGAFLIALMLEKVWELDLEPKQKFVFYVVVAAGMWIALFPYVGELIYWSSIYKLLLVNIFFFVFYYEAVFKHDSSGHRKYVMALTAFLLGSSGVFTIGLFAVYSIFMFLEKRPKAKDVVLYLIFLLLPFALGSYYVNFAPSYQKYSQAISLDKLNLAADFLYLSGMLSCTGFYPYFAGIVLGLWIKVLVRKDFKNPIYQKAIATFKWLFVGFGAYYALMPAYFKLNCRHTFVFSVFLVLFLIYFSVYFIPVKKIVKLSAHSFGTVLLIALTMFVFSVLQRSYVFYTSQYQARLDQVNAQRYHDAIVCNIDQSSDPFRYRDIGRDKDFWANPYYARYYKLKSVATDTCCSYYRKHRFYWPRQRLYYWAVCNIQWKTNCRLKRKR